jgi:hypothetical protein
VPDLDFIEPFEYSHGWRDIVNDVSFDVEERVSGDEWETVWESTDTLSLSLGETIQVQAKANDPFREALDVEPGADVLFTGPGTVTTSISRRSGQSTIITVTAVGGAVTITYLRLRALPVPTARTVKVTASDAVSIAKHSARSNPDDAPWAGRHDAFAIAQLFLAHYAERRPTVKLRLVSSDSAHLLQILTRTISDLITIRHGELGLDADFHIENLQHTIARMPADDESGCDQRVHYTVLGCERSGLIVPDNPFTFDEAGAGFDDGVFDPTAADNPETVFIFDHPAQGQFDFGRFGT